MKTIILAGGLGSRISQETSTKPKPMIRIGNFPLIWHIMKIYSFYNFNEFIIALGYKGYVIKNYFKNYNFYTNNSSFYTKENRFEIHNQSIEDWIVHFLDTGIETQQVVELKMQ